MNEVLEQFFDFQLVRPYWPDLLEGFWTTVQLTFLGQMIAMGLGLVLALMRTFHLPRAGLLGRGLARTVRILAVIYIDLLRSLPALLVIILMWASFPYLPVPVLPDLTSFQIGFLALGIVYAAYVAEVYRAGIESVDRGQTEAARSLGMSNLTAQRTVILPQAFRRVIPPLTNEFITLSKDTALVGVIAVNELVAVARNIQSVTLNSSALVAAACFYLVFTLPLIRVFDAYIARERRRSGGGQTVIP